MSEEPLRILVVDDEPGMREGCRRILTSAGFEVETAADGLAGLELFSKQRNFAAVLVDLKMPRMGGLELIEKIHEVDPDVVSLVITAYATINTAVEATKRGAYGYVPKPFSPDELLLRIRNGLEARSLAVEARRLRDEREHRLLEVAAERSKSSTIIECMTDGVLVVNRDRQIVLRNAAARRALPEAASQRLPASLRELRCAAVEELIERVLAVGGQGISTIEITLGRGTYMVNASPVLDSAGETTGAVAVLRDITALQKLSAAKSMFVSMIAKELSSPLAAIESCLAEVTARLAVPEHERDAALVSQCLVRAKTMQSMVADLKSLVAVETGTFSIRRSPLDLAEVVAQVVESYREKALARGVGLGLAVDERTRGERVLADREAMRSVFSHIVDNALKYTRQGGSVAVEVGHDGLYGRVAVRDTGIGMTAEEQQRAFEEFYRASNDYTAGVPGTGLGLSLVKRFVDLHHGTVQIRSTPGAGSEVVVCIPASE